MQSGLRMVRAQGANGVERRRHEDGEGWMMAWRNRFYPSGLTLGMNLRNELGFILMHCTAKKGMN